MDNPQTRNHLGADAGDGARIAAYIQAAIETGDIALINHALGTVVRARGVSLIAREADISRENIYRAFSFKGNPKFGTVLRIITALGLRISVERAQSPKILAESESAK